MTNLASFYNRISKHYSQSNNEVSSKLLAVFIQQLEAHDIIPTLDSVLDLATGDGEALKLLQSHQDNLTLVGIDISEKMLSLAKKKLVFTALCGSLEEAESLVKGTQFDLVIAHFVCSYVGAEVLLEQAAKTNRQHGYLHISTSTLGNFPVLNEKLSALKTTRNPIVRPCYYSYRYAMNRINLPASSDELIKQAQALGYELIDHQTTLIPLRFYSSTEFVDFFTLGGWAGTMYIKFIPMALQIKWCTKMSDWFLDFPLDEQFIAESFLFKNVGTNNDSS